MTSALDCRILFVLHELASQKTRLAFPVHAVIAGYAECSERAVRGALDRLQRDGLILVTRHPPPHGTITVIRKT